MKEVYDSFIQIWMERTTEKLSRHFRIRREQFKKWTEGWHIYNSVYRRVTDQGWLDTQGCLSYADNCSFSTLYKVFGIDVIAFLFNKRWVPSTTVDPFEPDDFLDRLSVLEEASRGLVGRFSEIPLKLRGDAARFSLGKEGPDKRRFDEQKHGFFLELSLHELRKFGRFGRLLAAAEEPIKVGIGIYLPTGAEYSDDIMVYAPTADEMEELRVTSKKRESVTESAEARDQNEQLGRFPVLQTLIIRKRHTPKHPRRTLELG